MKKITEIKLILFDWDGVICNSFPIFYSIYSRLNPTHKVTMEDFRTHISSVSSENGRILPGRLADYTSDFCTADLFPCMHDIIKKLNAKGKKLVLVSNSPGSIIDYHLQRNGLCGLFGEVYTSDHKFRKPNLQLLDDISARFGFSESETVFIGDQVSDLLFIKHTNYLKFFCSYGFSSHAELFQTEAQFGINNVHYFKNSMDLVEALDQLQ